MKMCLDPISKSHPRYRNSLWNVVQDVACRSKCGKSRRRSDNATGNFIKIVQRVPVKILFDPESIKPVRDKIVAGLSAVPSIDVTEKVLDKPSDDGSETEKPSHQIASQPITQIRGAPAIGVMSQNYQ
jgi:hypothetical protein